MVSNLKNVRNILLAEMIVPVIVALAVIVLYETEILLWGVYAENQSAEFAVLTLMELLTVCSIPLALRLFKFRKVHEDLKERRESALLKWGSLRMMLLADTMLFNVVLYYLFANVAFGYMAIILFFCLAFVFPTMSRCQSEIEF